MALGMSAGDGWLGHGYSYDSEDSYDEEPATGPDPEAAPQPTSTIAIVRPESHEDVYAIGYQIGGHFRQDVPVIINLEDLTVENATRVVDFVAGAIYGRRGDIERLSNRLFLVIPPGSTVIRA
jgi:cell division inhibitor SepF